MKRFFLLLVAVFASICLIKAQQVNENFATTVVDTDISLSGWINSIQTGTRAWRGQDFDGTNAYAQATSFNSGEANLAYLITPALNITGSSETFSFDVNVGYWTHAALTVFISTDFNGTEGGITTATWTNITSSFTIPQTPTDAYGTFATAGSLDISSYTGTAYIAFVYTGDDNSAQTTTIQVDNVIITGNASVKNLSSGLSIYPNPVKNNINISSKEIISKIQVISIIGQEVFNGSFNSKNIKIPAEKLINGVYFVRATDIDGKTSVTKIVKE